ncbi:adenine-specific methyltransferase EcoRI family protein [Treponema endosymbiont of Eucomonympha sp.]|uniref:adenine-specific methyltransferase EcoRI family protein n=1 Tax=Treponema endosymbiont of Eucomonympha sp. TaxID=1580831 RepID=UPI000B2B6472|nr:adenine-specific methyltransferase EcoRI family protein [Treponema endosymbiont of Eucomonympha sp.]
MPANSFLIIGNKNAITYKEVFPLIKENKIWTGASGFSKDILFISAEGMDIASKPKTAVRDVGGVTYLRSPSIWFTNIDHGRRHQPLPLMSAKDNLKFSKHKELKGKLSKKKSARSGCLL